MIRDFVEADVRVREDPNQHSAFQNNSEAYTRASYANNIFQNFEDLVCLLQPTQLRV